MAVGDVKITVVPPTSATATGELSISSSESMLTKYINDNRPTNHIVMEVDFRGPRPIIIYRQTS